MHTVSPAIKIRSWLRVLDGHLRMDSLARNVVKPRRTTTDPGARGVFANTSRVQTGSSKSTTCFLPSFVFICYVLGNNGGGNDGGGDIKYVNGYCLIVVIFKKK